MIVSPTAGEPCLSGLTAPIACSCSRPSEATTGGSRARDALDGHKQGAGVLIHGGAFAAPLGAVVERRRRPMLQTRPGLHLETARQPCARVQKKITVHDPKPAQGLAAAGLPRQEGPERAENGDSDAAGALSGGRISRPASSHGRQSVSRGLEAARVVA